MPPGAPPALPARLATKVQVILQASASTLARPPGRLRNHRFSQVSLLRSLLFQMPR
ncbi:hypothetical protein CSB93_0894 [Pseudomonas paraeruginosa]|uniref:Uncharacterized protein n=1 Tax=Pseudomonas paraeruginosa TaxID=2994495 RepID=A0A2R3IWW9_9PSED|nr:hypothetical protein CSB93_0894 [Pseudomonas paraeruginosa]AWE90058.1 hypothetical protein CSC28_6210 [Pseudomonas paraeruginosa]PTC33697.1 hypothetical protein CLJ1_5807 [Pseudomonas aeruginosa]